MSWSRGGRLSLRGFVAVALLAVVCLASACGSGQSLQATASPTGSAAFAQPKWGIALEYPSSYVRAEPAIDRQADPGLLYQVYFADPVGAKSGESALDVVGLSVRKMGRSAKPGDLRRYRKDFTVMTRQLMGAPDELRMAEPFALTKLGGREALRGVYAYQFEGVDLAVVAYLVPIGERVYWITGQASRDTWGTAGQSAAATLASITFTQAR